MSQIKLSTRLSMKDYLNVNFFMFFNRMTMKVLMGLGGVLLLMVPVMYSFFPGFYEEFPIFQLLFGLLLTIALPILVYVNAREGYAKEEKIKENIVYEITQDGLSIKGETFEGFKPWTEVKQILESKHWIIFSFDKTKVNVIAKRDCAGTDLENFKTFIQNHPDIQYKPI